VERARATEIEHEFARRSSEFSRKQEEAILAIDPVHVTEQNIRGPLSNTPAPRIINIHGGIASVIPKMVSFSDFLIGMGYPASSITNPADGTYTFSCYEDSDTIAGVIAWYYEKEGLRPMMVGHSQGGFQVVKVLHKLAARPSSRIHVWNPLTWTRENRVEITDPLTGTNRPVSGLRLPYATSLTAGGLTRILPNQWDMLGKLREIPDSVEEFTGFYKGKDLLGGDFLGYGPANQFSATGTAVVRNVQLPSGWKHGAIPDTRHLLKSKGIMDRINAYVPDDGPLIVVEENDDTMNPESLYEFWAEDVWFSIKKHWVLELQHRIRARRAADRAAGSGQSNSGGNG
jgi:hypothetical protein